MKINKITEPDQTISHPNENIDKVNRFYIKKISLWIQSWASFPTFFHQAHVRLRHLCNKELDLDPCIGLVTESVEINAILTANILLGL